MSKKVFLETDEYDIFMFPVPEPVLKGNKFLATIFPRKTVKEWVISWMQKLHPCFDGRFLSDIKFYKEKGKIMALVTVADKLKVASHLEKRNTAVYVYRPEKRRVFAGNVSGRRFWLASAFVAALVMATLSGFALRSDSRIEGVPDVLADVPERDSLPDLQSVPNAPDVESSPLDDSPLAAEIVPSDAERVLSDDTSPDAALQSSVVVQPQPSELALCGTASDAPDLPESPAIPSIYDTPFIDEFISALAEGGCRISSFRWQTEPSASAMLSVEGCFPEQIYACVESLCGDLAAPENENLPRLSFSSISYADNVPSFSVVLDYSGFETMADDSEGLDALPVAEVSAKLATRKGEAFSATAAFRKLMVSAGGRVSVESFEPPSVSGVIPGESWNAFSEEASCLLSSQAVGGVSSVLFETLPSDDVSVSISFDTGKTSFFPLERVSVLFDATFDESDETMAQKNKTFLDEASSALELAWLSASSSAPENPPAHQPLPQVLTQHDADFISMCQIGSVCMGGNVYVKFYRDYDGKIFKGEPYEKN